MRVGIGYDCHRLVHGRRLFLGGVEIPFSKGLLGHSDGDVILHAITDALLGTISEEDIGSFFPDSDERIRGIRSTEILSHIIALLEERGYKVVNIDAVVIAQEPKIAHYRGAIRDKIAGLTKIPIENVSIKGKTTEGLGFQGRGEGIEVYAVALIERQEMVGQGGAGQ
jgi:2-C-methyl-D-erythritol 2,4-cyclodiphosphate synthase